MRIFLMCFAAFLIGNFPGNARAEGHVRLFYKATKGQQTVADFEERLSVKARCEQFSNKLFKSVNSSGHVYKGESRDIAYRDAKSTLACYSKAPERVKKVKPPALYPENIRTELGAIKEAYLGLMRSEELQVEAIVQYLEDGKSQEEFISETFQDGNRHEFDIERHAKTAAALLDEYFKTHPYK